MSTTQVPPGGVPSGSELNPTVAHPPATAVAGSASAIDATITHTARDTTPPLVDLGAGDTSRAPERFPRIYTIVRTAPPSADHAAPETTDAAEEQRKTTT